MALAGGWNPVYQPQANADWCVNLYSKGSETIAAAVYRLTGYIQTGKIFNFLFIFASFFLSLEALNHLPKIKRKTALTLSALLALNPVSVTSSLSFYVDGQLASLLVCLFSLALLIILENKTVYYFTFCLTLALATTVKFTGLVIAFFLCLGLAAGLLIYQRFSQSKKFCLFTLAAGLAGFFILGFNPYITNTVKFGHPFFPFYGKNRLEYYMVHQLPANFSGKNRLNKLGLSLFPGQKTPSSPIPAG